MYRDVHWDGESGLGVWVDRFVASTYKGSRELETALRLPMRSTSQGEAALRIAPYAKKDPFIYEAWQHQSLTRMCDCTK